MKRCYKSFLYSHFLISLACVSLYVFYTERADQAIDLIVSVFLFLSTFFSYHLVKFTPSLLNQHENTNIQNHYLKYKFLYLGLFSLIALVLFYLITYFEIYQILIVLFNFVLVFFYERNFFNISLRKIRFLKSPIIAFVWANSTVLLSEISLQEIPVYWSDAFIYIFLLCLIIDLKDFHIDKKSELSTFVNFSNQKVTYFALVLTYSVYGLFQIIYYHEFSFIICLILFYFALYKIHSHKMSKSFLLLLIDGQIILRLLLLKL